MFSVVIQAGGKSLRMGKDKVMLQMAGKPLIQHVIDRFTSVTDDLVVIAQKPEELVSLGHPVYPDEIPGHGPLMGLLTGLEHAKNEIVAVLACDMPFASLPLIQHEVQILVEGIWDVVIPVVEDKAEPLHAVYRRSACLPAIEKGLKADMKRLIEWHSIVDVYEMGAEEIKPFDPHGMAFFNINTPDDLLAAERIYKTGDNIS